MSSNGLQESDSPEAVADRRLEHVASHPLYFDSDEEVRTSALLSTSIRITVQTVCPEACDSCLLLTTSKRIFAIYLAYERHLTYELGL